MLKIFLLLNLISCFYAQTCKNLFGKTNLPGKCMMVSECIGAALIGDCEQDGHICCIPDKIPYPFNSTIIPSDIFLKIVGNTTRNRLLYYFFADSMKEAKIDNEFKAAAYLSQLSRETNNFELLESAKNLSKIEYEKDGSRDESFYKGRGAIYLKGKQIYKQANMQIKDLTFNIFSNPERAAFPSIAFKIAAWFWSQNENVSYVEKSFLNNLADGTYYNFALLSYSLNSNESEITERVKINDQILESLKFSSLKRGQGLYCDLNDQIGRAVPMCDTNQNSNYCGCEGQFTDLNLNEKNKKLPNFFKCCIDSFTKAIDLLVIYNNLNTSENNKIIKKNFKSIIDKFKIGFNDTRVSLIENNNILMNFSETQSKSNLLNIIDKLEFNANNVFDLNFVLDMANKTILQENNGMRPIENGVPRIILLIANVKCNITDLIKDYYTNGYNFIVIGLNECKKAPLNLNDFFYVKDINTLDDMVPDILIRIIKSSSLLKSSSMIKSSIGKNSYKYFRYKMEPEIQALIEFDQINGSAELYLSYEIENPKDILQSVNQTNTTQRKIRLINNEKNYRTVYLSVKGNDEENNFELKISNGTLTEIEERIRNMPIKKEKKTSLEDIFGGKLFFIMIIFAVIIIIALSIFITLKLKKRNNNKQNAKTGNMMGDRIQFTGIRSEETVPLDIIS